MPSILPGYEYDIFISYRQKDNKTGWVTEFVENLRNEIEATFKEEISIYFDSNPHDGLHETHDVDGSLKEKVKCLVFIPIVSQTYCDPNAFAWQKELLPFLEFARQDEYGLDIKVAGGNVSKRVLPVRIHEIDKSDKILFEEKIDGVMRPVDFIYKEIGVNRPLAPIDDKKDNQNSTDYRNQINKMANAIREVIIGLKNPETPPAPVATPNGKSSESSEISKKWIGFISLVLIVLTLATLGYFKFGENTSIIPPENPAIAILAFSDQSPEGDQEWLGDGVSDQIINVLAGNSELKVIGKTSSFAFKSRAATIKEIGEALDVTTILEGSVSKIGDQLRITATLIDVSSETQIWSNSYNKKYNDLFSVIDDVSQNISSALISKLAARNTKPNSIYKPLPDAYEYYLKGVHFHWDLYIAKNQISDYYAAEQMFQKAIQLDPKYGDAYAGLADVYDTRAERDLLLRSKLSNKRDSVISIGFKMDPNSPYLLVIKGITFRQGDQINLDSAFYYFEKAYQIDPNHTLVNQTIAISYRRVGLLNASIAFSNKILRTDPLNQPVRNSVLLSYVSLGETDEAKELIRKDLEIDSTNTWTLICNLKLALYYYGDTTLAKNMVDKIDPVMANSYALNRNIKDAYIAQYFALRGEKEKALALSDDLMVYVLLKMKDEVVNKLSELVNNTTEVNDPNQTYLFIQNCPLFDYLRDDPGFQSAMVRLEKEYEERARKFSHLFD